jgi:hypothetical protein
VFILVVTVAVVAGSLLAKQSAARETARTEP